MSYGRKSLSEPDEKIAFPNIVEDIVDMGDVTVGRVVQQPGFRWSVDVKPHVGGEWCQARHIGVVVSGRMGATLSDGREIEFGPNDVYDLPPGHDGYTVGDEPAVLIEWSGLRTFAGPHSGTHGRVLSTLMFTDIVESTSTAHRLGDVGWRDLLSRHYQTARSQLERFKGREVNTTGDGFLAVFDGPAAALRCAQAIRRTASEHGLQVRSGVHVGEVELVGSDVRGLAVHEAARVLGAADPGEILASEVAKSLATVSGLEFAEKGSFALKGIEGHRTLFSLKES